MVFLVDGVAGIQSIPSQQHNVSGQIGSSSMLFDLQQSKKLDFQAVIKSAASAASLDLQGSLAGPAVRMPRAVVRWLPCKSREAAQAADLITTWKFSFMPHSLPEIIICGLASFQHIF